MDLGDLALGHVQSGDAPRLGGGNLDHCLVGHHIHDRLVFLDVVALGDAPLHHFALDDALADVRQDKVLAGDARGRCRRCRRGAFGRGGIGRLRRRGRGVALGLIGKQRLMHLGDLALGHVQAGHTSRLGSGNLDQRLVGHHLDDRLVLFDDVTFGNAPLHHLTLHDTFADIGQLEICHLVSPVLKPGRQKFTLARMASTIFR